ncbi:MAG TPA: hypothetical protein VFN21_03410, partial [Acidimicrobiales bacterium]|nr:hypothetical protein [Acidimicrobiales bacterium]
SAIAAGTVLAGPFLINLFPSFPQLTPSLTAAAGVGLGDDPNGAITSNLRPGWAPLVARWKLLGAGGAVIIAAYVATVSGMLSNWIFAGVLVAVIAVMPLLAAERRSNATDTPLSASPVRLARDLPLSTTDLAALDDLLGVGR